ncbi:LysM peptidoglycan-binding domain-containing protein [Cellulosimicrobium cellulans]|uniref:LysM peptidoglycan-binding domain-containing protein n=1 Tax=Cellulosimicrobium cellulans TaxID=1710 RepID=UPI00209B4644|nr:LysM peptidoglycan-binding domain-containing protein [Cellulosimicrobium cellulans]
MSSMTTTWTGPVRGGVRAVSRPQPVRLRLTRRGRVVVTLLALVVALLGVRVGDAVAGAPGEPVEVRVHVVTAGETLWGHAQRLAGPGEDVRDVVARIAELNGLGSSGLQTGQRLLLPVEG